MFRQMLAATALAVLIPGAALSQDVESAAQPMGGAIFSDDSTALDDIEGFFESTGNLVLATSLIGETLYTGGSDEDEMVGEIRDIVMAQNGIAEAVVVGVGGFLGLGEKDVAVEFSRISRAIDSEGDVWLVIDATAEELEAAPSFDRESVREQEDQAAEAVSEEGAAEDAADPAPVAPAEGGADADVAAGEQQMMPLDGTALSAEQIMGLDVYGADEENLGDVSDVLVDPAGEVDGFVVDVGGFLGLGAKPVAIGLDNLQVMVEGEEWQAIHTGFTQEQLEAHAEYSEEAYQNGDEAVVLRAGAD